MPERQALDGEASRWLHGREMGLRSERDDIPVNSLGRPRVQARTLTPVWSAPLSHPGPLHRRPPPWPEHIPEPPEVSALLSHACTVHRHPPPWSNRLPETPTPIIACFPGTHQLAGTCHRCLTALTSLLGGLGLGDATGCRALAARTALTLAQQEGHRVSSTRALVVTPLVLILILNAIAMADWKSACTLRPRQ